MEVVGFDLGGPQFAILVCLTNGLLAQVLPNGKMAGIAELGQDERFTALTYNEQTRFAFVGYQGKTG